VQYATGSAYPLESDSNRALAINGNGAVLRRSTGTANFRILVVNAGARVTLDRLIISNGVQTGNAAGILNNGNLTLTNCTVSGNAGRGIYNEPGRTLVVNDSSVRGNTSTGIFNFAGNATVNRSAIVGNMGGGIFNRGTLTLTNSTVSGNSASGNGGGILQQALEGAPLFLVNTTISNNSASGSGGGLYSQSPPSLSTVSSLNTIIAANTAGSGPDVFVTGAAITSQGYNLIGKIDGSSGWIASDLTGTSAMPLDPMLAPLSADFIHPLLANSPALDAADDAVLSAPFNLATDQRLVPRREGAQVDIGAFEIEPSQAGPQPLVTTTHEHNDGVCGIADCTLGEAIAFANANPDATTITFTLGLNGAIMTRSTPDGLIISAPTTIEGPGARILTISGDRVARIFAIDVGPTIISHLTLANGRSELFSGGAIVNGADLTLNRCHFDNNFTFGDGGAIYNVGPLGINNCTFTRNVANSGFGGAIHNFADSFALGNVTAVNCTFQNNRAVGGGALSNKASGRNGTSILRNCTISGNVASLNGTNKGGGLNNQGTATRSFIRLENSIVADNASDDGAPDVFGAITSGGYNLVGDGTESTGLTNGVNQDQVGTGASPINPQLGPLQNNGGPTDTRALLAASTARDAGNDTLAPPLDQRGFGRSGVSDIGAFEFDGIPPAVELLSVASRKVHGGAGSFDIDLPLVSPPGIECRTGGTNGDHTMIFSFATTLASVGGASVSSGIGNVSSSAIGTDAREYVVNLSDVPNVQEITVTLTNVTDSLGNNSASVPATMAVLLGDTTATRIVNASDIGQTKAQSGAPVTAANFRADVNVNGSINASDISLVKARSGTALP
jgi:hypothetical protein